MKGVEVVAVKGWVVVVLGGSGGSVARISQVPIAHVSPAGIAS